jgi:hypothetical protein
MANEEQAALQDDMQTALQGVIAKREISLVTKWVVLIEIVDGNGDRALWTAASKDIMSWETKGLLQHALDVEAAGTAYELFNSQNEDEETD